MNRLILLALSLASCDYVKDIGPSIDWYDDSGYERDLNHTISADTPISCADVHENGEVILAWDEYWAGMPTDVYALVGEADYEDPSLLRNISAFIEIMPDEDGSEGLIILAAPSVCPDEQYIVNLLVNVCCY